MTFFYNGGCRIHYTVSGSGPAVLLLAPGGMRSAISFWDNAPWNPIEALQQNFTVVAMDQRNAGQSFGIINAEDGWDTYAEDQLALMSHLEFERFAVAGMCIGGPFALNLIRIAPARVRAAVLMQSIGRDGNYDLFLQMFDSWANELLPHDSRPPEAIAGLRANLFENEASLFCMLETELSAMTTPMLILRGDDSYHPSVTSEMIAATAPHAELIAAWKEGDEAAQAAQQMEAFLAQHSG